MEDQNPIFPRLVVNFDHKDRKGATTKADVVIENLPPEEFLILADKTIGPKNQVESRPDRTFFKKEAYVYPPGSKYGSPQVSVDTDNDPDTTGEGNL